MRDGGEVWLATLSLGDLIRAARAPIEFCRERAVPAVRQVEAIRVLRNYFSPQLQERDDWRMAGSTDADSFWAERLAEVEAVGVAVSCQVCCHTCHVRAGFRRDGCRKPAIAPILPCSAPLQEDLRFLSPGARREVYEKYLVQRGYFSPQQVHGSALFYLPADFLCPPHQA